MPTAAIVGTGLIGASLGIALRHLGWEVTGWDPDPAALGTSSQLGALDHEAPDFERAVADSDLVLLAGPPISIVAQLGSLAGTDALVTDVAGVKGPIVAAASASGVRRFVGGHPMAGRETSGPSGASGSLFRGATWVLTTDGVDHEALETITRLVADIGAVPLHLTAFEHDQAVAGISHLPQVLASALVNRVARTPSALDLAAGGFRDLTRIALSANTWWPEVLIENRTALADLLRSLGTDLASWADMVDRGEEEPISAALLSARAARRSLQAPVASIGVVLEDKPGEIARVGHALEVSRVDLRDLQLRHATHGGGGVLTLSVRASDLDLLSETLHAEGFTLI